MSPREWIRKAERKEKEAKKLLLEVQKRLTKKNPLLLEQAEKALSEAKKKLQQI